MARKKRTYADRVASDPHYKQKMKLRMREVKGAIKKQIVEDHGGKCIRCGYNKCIAALEFHHRVPADKAFRIGGNTRSLETQRKEAEKCDLLCANCHREVHYEQAS